MPRVADLVDAMIDYWRDLVPLKSKDGGRGAILFRCIHALMSLQVRDMIKRSLDHLYQTLNVYKVMCTLYVPFNRTKSDFLRVALWFRIPYSEKKTEDAAHSFLEFIWFVFFHIFPVSISLFENCDVIFWFDVGDMDRKEIKSINMI